MQKLINALAVFSFLGTAAIIGTGYYVYSQREEIIETVKEAAIEAALENIVPEVEVPELPAAAPVALPSSSF